MRATETEPTTQSQVEPRDLSRFAEQEEDLSGVLGELGIEEEPEQQLTPDVVAQAWETLRTAEQRFVMIKDDERFAETMKNYLRENPGKMKTYHVMTGIRKLLRENDPRAATIRPTNYQNVA